MEFTNEQKLLFDSLNDLMDKEIGRDYCREQNLKGEYPQKLIDAVIKYEWNGLLIPKDYGGYSGDAIDFAIFNEVLSKYGLDIPGVVYVNMLTANNLSHFGTTEQKDYYLPRYLDGRLRFSISITEPEAGSDAAS